MKLKLLIGCLACTLYSSVAQSLMLLAEQTYENGAYSSATLNVEIIDNSGTPTIRTIGIGFDSPDSFFEGTFVSQSGYTYTFDETAVLGFEDVYVDTPLSDLASGIPTGTVWYHFFLDKDILASGCITSQCYDEAPTQFSEFAIWSGTSYPSDLVSLNANNLRISLTAVPLPTAAILFSSSIALLFGFRKKI